MFIRDPRKGTDVRGFGQLDAGVITATTPDAPASGAAALVPYYFMAVAAGVTVWFLTRWLGKR